MTPRHPIVQRESARRFLNSRLLFPIGRTWKRQRKARPSSAFSKRDGVNSAGVFKKFHLLFTTMRLYPMGENEDEMNRQMD
ncbi:hypothetical protein, partial [Rhodoblastus sp.]|uniref:hypothetical protein n=1 Tax=Rhodoblastus sp. TaxID=1962975 RepID=UPI003F9D7F6A